MCCVMPPASPAATRARADVVEQRGLAVVDVAHHGDHRRARQLLVLRCSALLFLEEGFRVVELGGKRLVAHFLDHDHRRLLVELLVDGDHLAQLHQLLDDLGGLDRHLVRQVGHADGLGHVHFLHLLLGRRRRSSTCAPSLRSPRRPPRGARQPGAGAARGASLRPLSAARFLAASSAQLDDSFSDLTDFLSPGLARRPRRGRRARRAGLLVDRALDASLAGFAGLAPRASSRRSTFFGAFIIARIAAASSSAALRRLARSAARCFSSSTTSAALMTRSAGLGGSAGAAARRGARQPRRPQRPSAALPALAAGLAAPRQRPARRRPRLGGLARGFARRALRRPRARAAPALRAGGASRPALPPGGAAARPGRCASSSRRCSSASSITGAAGSSARRRVVALDEGALLAHLDLDGARLAARIGLLDLAGRLARQRDLLALAAGGGAVRGAQEVEQALLVGLGQRVVGRRLARRRPTAAARAAPRPGG